MASHFDIVVVGSGAGGATLAQRLAPTGKSILILERGEHVPREAENWSPKAVFIEHRYRTQERWYDKHGHPFTPNTHYWVGGNTTFYGAALMRLRKGDFDETQHAGGVSPAWPISLTDLAPYYDEAETAVAGARRARRGSDRERRRAALRLSRHPPRSGHRRS
jgi:choline dehydrogenase-like flavoprotein